MSELLSDAAFAALYQSYSHQIYQLCLSYCNDRDLANDLLQETFILVWKNRTKFRGEAQVRTWIYRIAVNTCLGHIRSTQNKQTDSLTQTLLTHHSDDQNIDDEQSITLLYQAIQQLPEPDRLLIGMVLQELPYEQIAEALGIQEGTLRVKIHRVKKQLATIFTELQKQ
ncbi:sigma-70 family RNA polymerase sigma factor [Cytophagaceae bacterium DM2B3-1]|uniref:Sigma-70 family RNA polymerase sigma factor n=1 Tax=Xanthocytophaga flava TaxID=3048013 RepID=A0ABT7CRL4_9BACT|nr:sigma-70 family RNA polymerase sigma factor [Xanthocytophaga flavus]MDJ1468582.1 sigma-70 family RNA polymerase sigma factor [Xanthocytophaga flavus]MDJ1496362.1 sigma-70 family RNA polymerase sigma factor [Xanthocytophaga flavus]